MPDPTAAIRISLHQHEDADALVLELTGDLDVYTAPRLREQLVWALKEPQGRIVVDLTGVRYLDSTALAHLMRGCREAGRQNKTFRIVATTGQPRQVFERTAVAELLGVRGTLAEALGAE